MQKKHYGTPSPEVFCNRHNVTLTEAGEELLPLEGGNYSMEGCVHRLKDGYRKHSADIFIDMLRDSAQIERITKGLE